MAPTYQGLPLRVLAASATRLVVHLDTQQPIRALELPNYQYHGRWWVPFTTRLRSPITAAYYGLRSGYEIEYRPLRSCEPEGGTHAGADCSQLS